jgi:hypothetical protein
MQSCDAFSESGQKANSTGLNIDSKQCGGYNGHIIIANLDRRTYEER